MRKLLVMEHSLIDLIAYRPDGKVVLLVEVKSRRGTSASWAAKLRRNMLAHGTLPDSQFLLIATPERIFGWRQENLALNDVPPQFFLDAEEVLKPYFAQLRKSPDDISPSAFKLLILAWLTDISRSSVDQVKADDSLAPLVESGLLSSLHEAQIELDMGR